jgi:putative salt-induced outer membrane protein
MINKISSIGLSVVLTTALFSTTSVAQDLDDLTSGWSGTANVGMTNAGGNSRARSLSAGIRLGKTVGQWRHIVVGSVLTGESTILVERRNDQGEVEIDPSTNAPIRDIIKGDNAERYALAYQPRYLWKEDTYFFGILDWERDRPANIKTATRQIAGIGHTFWRTNTGFFSAEAGVGNKNLTPVFGDDLDGGIGYVGFNFLNRLSETTTFNADFKSDFGSDNTFTEIGLGLTFKVSDKMSVKVSHFLRNNTGLTDPTNPLSSDTDTVTTFNLLFDI